MSCFEDEMVILPVSSTKQGLNEDETKRESYLPMQEIG